MQQSSLTIKMKKCSDQQKKLIRKWKPLLRDVTGPVVGAQLSQLSGILHCQFRWA